MIVQVRFICVSGVNLANYLVFAINVFQPRILPKVRVNLRLSEWVMMTPCRRPWTSAIGHWNLRAWPALVLWWVKLHTTLRCSTL
jgi:hypothetical protein